MSARYFVEGPDFKFWRRYAVVKQFWETNESKVVSSPFADQEPIVSFRARKMEYSVVSRHWTYGGARRTVRLLGRDTD